MSSVPRCVNLQVDAVAHGGDSAVLADILRAALAPIRRKSTTTMSRIRKQVYKLAGADFTRHP